MFGYSFDISRPNLTLLCKLSKNFSCAVLFRVSPLCAHLSVNHRLYICLDLGLETSTGIVSIFVEDEAMCLLDDNCAQWPLSKLARVALAGIQTPPYKLIARKPITDISSLVRLILL